MILKRMNAPCAGMSAALIAAALLSVVAPEARASHIGEDLTVDQQAVTSTNQLLGALRQYETADANQRGAALQRLTQLATQRRERMLALIERNPTLAALRVLPTAVRSRLPAQAQVERDVGVVGVVQATIGDDFVRGRSTKRFEVLDAAGQRFELRVADATERDMLAMVGKRANIAAVQIDRQLLVLDKRRVQLLAAGGTTTTTTMVAAATTAVQGDQTTLVMLLNFNDLAVSCTAADLQSRLFGTSGSTMNVGYQQSSGNLVSFSGQVVGPYTINYKSTDTCDPSTWATAANALAIAAGFNPSSYKRVSYAMPSNSTCGWSGLATLGGTSPTPSWIQACTATGVFSHELGHNLNFHHAATPTYEYGDGSDAMGGASLVQSNAANRVMAGWMSGSQVQTIAASGTYSLTALENAGATSPQVLRLPKADTAESYYVSLRQPVGVDATLSAAYQNTLSIHRSTGTLPAKTFLLANLAAGQTWTDSVNGIVVSNQGVSGSSASVGVSLGGGTCVQQVPTVGATPVSQTAAGGATIGYTLSVINNNSAACPSAVFNLTQSLPLGFSGNFGAPSVSLASGASANVGWNVASPAGSADATYTLTATASDSATVSSGQVHTAYVVSAPPPPPPPPPPTGDTTAPSVTITSPASGSALTGRNTTITAAASDNVGVASVQFYIDDQLVATDTSAPYSTSWNLRKVGRGAHTIRVRALDAAGNATEQSLGVTVQ